MKVNELILLEADAENLVAILERDCGPFLKQSKKQGLLYRGIKGSFSNKGTTAEGIKYAIKEVRTDRKPLHTTESHHEIIDAWFKKKFGFNARSESMFCFGDVGSDNIAQYGKKYIVFPIGDFKYVWSSEVRDLWQDFDNQNVRDESDIIDLLNDSEYTKAGLGTAVSSNNEIMIKCEKYYAFPMSADKKIRNLLGMSTRNKGSLEDFLD